jgi:hypothetical protein
MSRLSKSGVMLFMITIGVMG